MTGQKRKGDAGFTLIETLVALAVLAMSSVTLLATTTAHVSRISGLEARAAARWTAENHLVALSLGLDADPALPVMLGYAFVLQTETIPTSDRDVDQHIVTVRDSAGGGSLARLIGFTLRETGRMPGMAAP